jgi:hypothetical protein
MEKLGLGGWSNALTSIFANNFLSITAIFLLTYSLVQSLAKSVCVNLQITAKAYGVVERLSVLVQTDMFKVGGSTKDVKRTGCHTAHQPDRMRKDCGNRFMSTDS